MSCANSWPAAYAQALINVERVIHTTESPCAGVYYRYKTFHHEITSLKMNKTLRSSPTTTA